MEIQRLVGRSLRAALDLTTLGPRTITLDCDILEADGGTRTASVTAGFIATALALSKVGALAALRHHVAAVSVGFVGQDVLVDLDYPEDRDASVDANVVMTGSGHFVEVQSSGEEATYTRAQLDELLALAEKGIAELVDLQQAQL